MAKRKVPTLIAASTVTSPARLNHAVTQPHPRPPRIAAQWYSPPAVGNAEAICPIVAATHSENRHTRGHASPIDAPPTEQNPNWNDVMPPARMQMMESEMAKFENPPSTRASSCAYPNLCRVRTSSDSGTGSGGVDMQALYERPGYRPGSSALRFAAPAVTAGRRAAVACTAVLMAASSASCSSVGSGAPPMHVGRDWPHPAK